MSALRITRVLEERVSTHMVDTIALTVFSDVSIKVYNYFFLVLAFKVNEPVINNKLKMLSACENI